MSKEVSVVGKEQVTFLINSESIRVFTCIDWKPHPEASLLRDGRYVRESPGRIPKEGGWQVVQLEEVPRLPPSVGPGSVACSPWCYR